MLTPARRGLLAALTQAVLGAMSPAEPQARTRAIEAQLNQVQGTIAGLPLALQAEVDKLITLAVEATGRVALARLMKDWSQASAVELHDALQGMPRSVQVFTGPAPTGLPCAARHDQRRVLCKPYRLARHRLPRVATGAGRRRRLTHLNPIVDPVREGLARGWKVHRGPHAPRPAALTCDVSTVGTGAGAGITGKLLTVTRISVVMIEEGSPRGSTDFRQIESAAYPTFYQDSASRQTADKAINILQGRCVDGSTTVNWTSSFRTPSATLQHWRERFALPEMSDDGLPPGCQQAEKRLNMGLWLVSPNVNNSLLKDAAGRLGIPAAITRNVKGCWNLGSCGMCCPTNVRQSMLVTTIFAALDRGATLRVQTRAQRLELVHGKVQAVVCVPVAPNGAATAATGARVTAGHVVVAGGAINSPTLLLLLRSGVADPHGRPGLRTFLHPARLSMGVFSQRVAGWEGAPQTLYTDHFLQVAPIDGLIGYKLEAPPLHPVVASSTLPALGAAQTQTQRLNDFAHTRGLPALLRSGFHEQSPGGRVKLRSDGSPVLDYPLTPFVMHGARRALLSMAEIPFAACARTATREHEQPSPVTSWQQATAASHGFDMLFCQTRVVSAHVMDGCGMAGRPELGTVQPNGRPWQVKDLSAHDGSLFPTSVGANPQLSVYRLANKLVTGLTRQLAGRCVRLA